MPRTLSIKPSIVYSKTKCFQKKGIWRRLFVRKKRNSRTEENNFFVLSFFISLLIIICFAFFLYLNLQLVESNFNLREKEKELSRFKSETEKLEIQVGGIFSIQEIRERSKELDLVKAEDIRYLETDKKESLSLENR